MRFGRRPALVALWLFGALRALASCSATDTSRLESVDSGGNGPSASNGIGTSAGSSSAGTIAGGSPRGSSGTGMGGSSTGSSGTSTSGASGGSFGGIGNGGMGVVPPSHAGSFASAGAGGVAPRDLAGVGSGGVVAEGGNSPGGAGMGGSGQAGSDDPRGAGAGGSSAAYQSVSSVFGRNCGIPGCHLDKEYPRFGADEMLYGTLTGGTVLAECEYTPLIEPGDVANSSLVRLLSRECGTFVMPPTCRSTPCISAEDMKALTDWIELGAPP